MTHNEAFGSEGSGSDPAIEVERRLTRRVDRLVRAQRRWMLLNAALLVGMAVLGAGGVHRNPAVGAQPLERKGGPRTDTEPQVEAQVKLALKALASIQQRINAGVGVLNRDHLTAVWSRRLLYT